jgi:uncharacterized protein (DUF427 family)
MTTEDAPGWKANPEYVFDFDLVPARVTGRIGDTILVDSKKARVALEQGHASLYYFPKEDVRLDLMHSIDHESFCPYKGVASYWALKLPDRTVDKIAWTYRKPFKRVDVVADHVGFFWNLLDEWQEDGVTVTAPRDILGRAGVDGSLRALYPELAKEWHPHKNPNIWSYEIAPFNAISVWWQDSSGREWQESVRARVLGYTGGVQDAHASKLDHAADCGCAV